MRKQPKVGDIVVASDYVTENYQFTKDKVYTIIAVDDDNVITIIDDDNEESSWDWYDDEYFDHVKIGPEGNENVAKELVGTSVSFGRNKTKYFVNDYCRIIPALVNADTPKDIVGLVNKHGHCICLVSGDKLFPASIAKTINNRLVLTDDYTALITKDSVVVGCQTIPYSKILEIVKIHTSIYE